MSRTESDRTESDLNPTSSFAPEICLGGEGRRRARGFAVFDPFVFFRKGRRPGEGGLPAFPEQAWKDPGVRAASRGSAAPRKRRL